MVDKTRFPLYGYLSSSIALLFFLAHFLYLIDRCPYGISTVIRISFIQVILAIFAMYFGCCSETKKAKISIIFGLIIIILVTLYYIFIINPCILS